MSRMQIISISSVQIDQEGKKAILQLANGDMRRALNILQVQNELIDNSNSVQSQLITKTMIM